MRVINIHKSFILAKNQCKDLIYFVEDDYLHHKKSITEMISSYERISSQIKKELIHANYIGLPNNILNHTTIKIHLQRYW